MWFKKKGEKLHSTLLSLKLNKNVVSQMSGKQEFSPLDQHALYVMHKKTPHKTPP